MRKELEETQGYLEHISDVLHFFIRDHISENWLLIIIIKLLLLGGIIYILDIIFKILFDAILFTFRNSEKYPFIRAIYTSKVSHSFVHLVSLAIGSIALTPFFEFRHPKTFPFFDRIIDLGFVFILAGLGFRVLVALRYYYSYKNDFYRVVALNAVSQTIKSVGVFIFAIMAISVVFGIKGSTILGSLGAITAVLVLVFRDTILGFMTGIHVATSKSLKVGDWIGIPKYDLQGTIEEINIITTKIQNFDKTISTIPTYDLLSTEIRNHQVMAEGNQRRIKKSIIFNINSFKFVDSDFFEKLQKINLLSDYLKEKYEEISTQRSHLKNPDLIINGTQLTNIGVFRKYVINYLKQDQDIDQNEIILVRQLDITPQGMPLEIYCFANKTELEDFEEIQADIFDHLLAAAKEFDLEIMQTVKM